ncbi:MAG: hypothetical protein ACREDM_02025 [Methylocella sp.]
MDDSPHAGGIRRAPPGSRKSPKIRKAIEAKGAARRFVPRCSPDFNPIDRSASSGDVLETEGASANGFRTA